MSHIQSSNVEEKNTGTELFWEKDSDEDQQTGLDEDLGESGLMGKFVSYMKK